MTQILEDVDAAAEAIVARAGPVIALGVPLGLGKPVPLVNALYQRVARDPAVTLRILTALTLDKPRGANAVQRAFLEPFVARVYDDCPDLDYSRALQAGTLPPNVEVSEFFFRPGTMLGNAAAQQHYVSSNYTHAARDAVAQGCNVVAQMVAKRVVDGQARYSLSSNPDTGLEVVERLRAAGRPCLTVALVNAQLPYMEGDAEVAGDWFDLVVDAPRYAHTLFSTPKLPVEAADFLIGLHASSLVRDGGTLQVGIGSLGDAVVHALLLRHTDNRAYRAVLGDAAASLPLVQDVGGDAPFDVGLYGASEMLVDGFMHLYRAGILKRRVYGFWALQQLLNQGHCDPDAVTPGLLEDLAELGVRVIRGQDFEILQHHGVFNDATRYDQGFIVVPDGTRVVANVADPTARRVLGAQGLGPRLRRGRLADAAFFLGTREFYQWLKDLPDDERRAFGMTTVARINQLDLNPRLYQQQRLHARFLNTGLMVTLGGAVVSDGLDDGRVVSGVGGQYNFIAMAHQLATGRAVLMVRATREAAGTVTSNIVYSYAHTTIPRHLRDLVVTEYGVADLRSKSDRDVAVGLLAVTDARFQDALLAQAQRAGKVESGFRIPDAWRANTPARVQQLIDARRALFPTFPLGTDFTPEEQVLAEALPAVKARVERGRLRAIAAALMAGPAPAAAQPYLARLRLEHPRDFESRVARGLLLLELKRRLPNPGG